LAILTVNTPFNIELEFLLAPFFKRVVAWLCDYLILILYSYAAIFLIIGAPLGIDTLSVSRMEMWQSIAIVLLISLPVLFYHLIFELYCSGRSPGKMLMGLQVVNKEGGSASISQYILRWIICMPNYMLPGIVLMDGAVQLMAMTIVLGLVFLPAVISIAVTAKSQRLGDIAAGTVVVDIHQKINIAETIYIEVDDDNYQPLYPQVLTLSDKDINGIKNLLQTKAGKVRDNYMLRVAQRIEEVLQVTMNDTPELFLQTLLKDYNYLTQSR
jgi:uncharacterized RDD family membrane protein YckC